MAALTIPALFCCFLWGSAFPCIKIGYHMFAIPSDAMETQILFAGLRFALAGLLVIAFGSIRERRVLVPGKHSWGMVAKLSLFQTVLQYLLFYIGLAHASGVKASIIEGVNVFASMLVASVLFHMEKMNGRKLAGCAAGFAGVVLINLNGSGLTMEMSFLGEGFILLSTLAYAVSGSLIKLYSKKEDTVVLSGWQFLVGGLFMMVCGFGAGGRLLTVSIPAVGMLIYLAFVSAAAYTIWGALLKRHPVSRVLVFGSMTPVFGVLLSAWFLREQDQAFGWKGIAALICVCAGIFVVNGKSGGTYEENKNV